MLDCRLLDLFPMGVVMLDAEARVRAANGRARRLLNESDGVRLVDGRIEALHRGDAVLLARLFAGGCPDEVVGGLHARGALHITRDGARSGLTVLVADAHGRPGAPASEFAVFLHQHDAAIAVSEGTLRALYGFTNTEARIAARLVDGGVVSEIAREIGVTTNTVRTHLKRVFGKIGVGSQGALIRVVMSGPAALQLHGGRGRQATRARRDSRGRMSLRDEGPAPRWRNRSTPPSPDE